MLEIRNLTKEYRPKKGKPVVALRNVSLKFPEKGMVFILGKSGSGKSTLLNLMGGLDSYDSGEIIIKGKSSKDFSQGDFDSYRNTYLGFIFQEYNILNEFNVAANIGLALELQGVKATDEAVNGILDEVDLTGYGSRKPSELSGGQKQRVAIARALVKSPEIIMADEPTGALDSNTGLQVFDTLKKLSGDKLVIVITHDRDFAEMYGDRVIELKDGEVLSDIEKYSAEAKRVSEGISVIDDKIIRIKKGYCLTAEDLTLINGYLAENEALLSVDDKSNRDLKRFARIGEDGSKESFRDTDEKSIEYSDRSAFRLIKSRLPFKNSLKIGASGLKSKPVRLVMTILLSLVAFTMFGLTDTLAAYDKVSATYHSIVDTGIEGLAYEKTVVVENGDYTYNTNVKMDDAAVNDLSQRLGTEFRPVYRGNYSLSLSSWLFKQVNNYYYILANDSMAGFIEADAEYIEKLGYSYKGVLPAASDEIAVSKFAYDHFAELGYRDDDRTVPADKINSVEEFLAFNPTLVYNNSTLRITAVIDTKFNEQHFAPLRDSEEMNIIDYVSYSEMRATVNFSYHGLIFAAPGFLNAHIQRPEDSASLNLNDHNGYYSINDRTGMYYQNFSVVKPLSEAKDAVFFDPSQTSVAAGEIMIGIRSVLNMLAPNAPLEDKQAFYKFLYNDYSVTEITDYVDNHEDEITASGILDNFPGQSYESLKSGDKLFLHMMKDEFGRLYSGYYLNDTILPLLRNNGYFDLLKGLRFYKNVSLNGFFNSGDVRLAGYYIDDKETGGYSAVISESEMTPLKANALGIYEYAIAPTPDNAGWKAAVALTYADSKNGTNYVLRNGAMSTVYMLNDIIETLADVFLYVGLGFALFAALMLTNFISTSIAYKKREIGILRAVGARSSDVYGIFCNESLIIALINYVFSVIATGVVVLVLNKIFRSEYRLSLTILSFGLRQLALMLAISVGVALIASFIPTFRISRKKPVDAIKG